ncbi:MAG TPA: DnaJ domain-containing protein [Spirochaetota bacterium]|jgi:curved DNA-binding protein CbpA|nr:MAG: Chaperone protein DnaJ [Spirochaetes bacterium ADurb.Bin133]HNZ27656.1 DnaJ domain-containing protein [Spirochaetota bacterium]HPY88754.1 DnaJ domain-containing protein [Spirochaetota bacterium]
MNESTFSDLKKIYKKLLIKYHPDTATENYDDSKIKQIIEAYQKLSSENTSIITNKPNSPIYIPHKPDIKKYYAFLSEFFIYSIKCSAFHNDKLDDLKEYIRSYSNSGIIDENILCILPSLLNISEFSVYNTEYEIIERNILNYIKNLLLSSDFITLLSNKNPGFDILINEILHKLNLFKDETIKLKLNSALVLISILQDDDVLLKLYTNSGQNRNL